MSLYKRKDSNRWCVHIRRKGFPPVYHDFKLKGEADIFHRLVMSEMDRCTATRTPFYPELLLPRLRGAAAIPKAPPVDPNVPSMEWTLHQAIKKYLYEELDKLKGAKQALLRLNMWDASEFSKMKLTDITPEMVHKWKVNRRKVVDGVSLPVSPSTLRNDLYRLSVLFETASRPITKHGWGLKGLKNPVKDITLPATNPARQRRLYEGEQERLMKGIMAGNHAEMVSAFVILALATGMRKSEILGLNESEVIRSTQGMAIRKQDTKNGSPRIIYLNQAAEDTVSRLVMNAGKSGNLFTIRSTTLDEAWKRARERADCVDLRIHDLRHEALSRMADAGFTPQEIMSMSGHKTSEMLDIYVNVTETNLRNKMARMAS